MLYAFLAPCHASQGRARYSCQSSCGNWYLYSPMFCTLQMEWIGETTDTAA